jgi:hypothetical protein
MTTSMIKRFETFSDLIEWKNKCPVCSNNLIYKVTTNTFTKSGSGSIQSVAAKISKHFEKVLSTVDNNGDPVDNIVTCSFKPNEVDVVSFPEVEAEFRLKENRGLVADFDAAMCLFELTIYCPHEGIGNGYEAKGSFDFQMDLDINSNTIPKIDNKLVFEFDNLKIDYELYKIVNIHLEDEKPNGNFIKIINDFYIGKTSFSMAEINLDGTMGTWKEKRIDLVNDSFFKFENSEKIYSRLNTIFLLK